MTPRYYAVGLNEKDEVVEVRGPNSYNDAEWDINYYVTCPGRNWHRGIVMEAIKSTKYPRIRVK